MDDSTNEITRRGKFDILCFLLLMSAVFDTFKYGGARHSNIFGVGGEGYVGSAEKA